MILTAVRPLLEEAALAVGLVTLVVVSWILARQGAAKAWREVAESRAAKIEEQEMLIAELRERLARLEAQVDQLKRHDLSSVIAWGREHEAQAARRHQSLANGLSVMTGVLTDIRDKLPEP